MNRRLLDLAIAKTAFEFLKNLGLLNFFSCCGAHRFGAKLDISHFISFLDFHIENRNMMKLAPPNIFQENVKKPQLKIMTLTVGIQKIQEIVETHVYTYPPLRIRIFTILPIPAPSPFIKRYAQCLDIKSIITLKCIYCIYNPTLCRMESSPPRQ